jgi:hypothetical protein
MKALGTHENHKQMPIGATPHKTEYLHRSLLERWRDLPAYRPKSLQPHEARIKSLLSLPLTEQIYPV